ADHLRDERLQTALVHRLVLERDQLDARALQHPAYSLVEDNPSHARLDPRRERAILLRLLLPIAWYLVPHFDFGAQVDLAQVEGQPGIAETSKDPALSHRAGPNHGEVVAAEHHVERGRRDRLAVRRLHQV